LLLLGFYPGGEESLCGGCSIKRLIILLLVVPAVLTCTQFALVKEETNRIKVLVSKNSAQNIDPNGNKVQEDQKHLDIGLILYREEATKQKVIQFYTKIAGSRFLAETILMYADLNEIPPPLAFSLAWVESKFNPRAVNQNGGSIDRGLFQLNSLSFPHLREEEFFEPATNAKNGMKYLRHCLDTGENEIVALAMYNAGKSRVQNTGAPMMTLDYIASILDFRKSIERSFEEEFAEYLPFGRSVAVAKRTSPILDRRN